MRLDKYLKISRVIKRRTIAADAANAGRISINGKVAKASSNVSINDIIEIKFGENIQKIRVLSLLENAKKEQASSLFEVLN